MELDNLKSIWQEQDVKLNENMKINKKILNNTFKQQSNGVIEYFLKWAYISLIEFVIFMILIGIGTYSAMNDWRFLIAGIFNVIFFILCIAVTVKGIQKLNSIDLFSKSIIETKRVLLDYKKQENFFKKIFTYVIPPVIISFLLVGVNFVRKINLFDYPVLFVVLATSIIVISYILLQIFHRTLFLRKFKLIENSLDELEKFEDD